MCCILSVYAGLTRIGDIMKCFDCGEILLGKRNDAKYCNDNCRDRYNNKKKKITRLIKRSKELLDRANVVASRNDLQEHANEQYNNIMGLS